VTMPITVVLVNYGGWADTIECLESLLRSTATDYRVVVVDNASTNESVARITAWARGEVDVWVSPGSPHRARVHPPVGKPLPLRIVDRHFNELAESARDAKLTLVAGDENGGFGAGNNLGMAFAVSSGFDRGYFWLLNNDTVIDRDVLGRLGDELNADSGIVGTRLMEYDDPVRTQTMGGGRLGLFKLRAIPSGGDESSSQPEFVNGASMLLPVSFYLESGGFDEAIFMYQEELDLCLRARALGYPIRLSEARVFHKHGASSASSRQWYWSFGSHYYVLRKHFGFGAWIVAHVGKLAVLSVSPFTVASKRSAARSALWDILGRIGGGGDQDRA
jgi:GT2 family glycosyltransferase